MVSEFYLKTKLLYGDGSFDCFGDYIKNTGKRAFIITGTKALKEKGLTQKLLYNLESRGIDTFLFDKVKPEPDTEIVDEGLKVAKENKCDCIISFGGGSVIDVGKAIAGLYNTISENETSRDYLEIDGSKKILKQGLPFIAIPALAGTGAEVTNNAVILNRYTLCKRSIRSEWMFPSLAVLDPYLIEGVPQMQCSLTSMDCLTHLIEGYISKTAGEVADIFAREGIESIYSVLKDLSFDNYLKTTRMKLLLSSVYGGILIFNSGLGLVHGIVSVIGPAFNISHGQACALFLPRVLEYNLPVINEQKKRYLEKIFGKSPVSEIYFLLEKLKIKKYIYSSEIIPDLKIKELTEKILETSSAKRNPREVNKDDLEIILKEVIKWS